MEDLAFDTLTRALADAHSRRGLLRLLRSVAFLGGPLALLGLSETAAKRKKGGKKKRKKRKRLTTTGGCGNGEKPCDGACIPNNQCCNNADCTISGQVCLSRQCACPEALPEICGGACLAPCLSHQVRDPTTCRCCIKNNFGNGGDPNNCCSLSSNNSVCLGQTVGGTCAFDEQCQTVNCVQQQCSGCIKAEDFCAFANMCSNRTGQCLRSVDGTIRCGIGEWANEGDCGWCTRNFDCDQEQRPGAFCAVNTGPNCGCALGQTFCARPA
jgi:hypothetical protein